MQCCLQFADDHTAIDSLWAELDQRYAEKSRHYHNLNHLESLFSELDAVKERIQDFSTLTFSVFYHDAVYDATSKANEEKSAALATSRMKRLNIDQDTAEKVSEQIIATKVHHRSEDFDTNYLLDADLSILGKNLDTYIDYTQKIRKEYSVYPDFLYKPGRKKVLLHFLERESIFKTGNFRNKYEDRARKNIKWEIENL